MKKVNLLWLALIVFTFVRCTSYDDTDGDWERSVSFAGPYRVNAVSFTDPDDGEVFIGMGYNDRSTNPNHELRDFWKFTGSGWIEVSGTVTEKTSDGRDTVVFKGSFPDTLGREGCVAFVIGRKAYVGAGLRRGYNAQPQTLYFSDFYAFDLDAEKWDWDQEANGHKRYSITEDLGISGADCQEYDFAYGVGFSYDGKGYVGTGQLEERATSRFYVFDPAAGWSLEPDNNLFPGDACQGAVVLDFGDQKYVCLGRNGSEAVRRVSIFDNGVWREGTPLNPNLPGAWNEEYDNVLRSFAMAFVSDKDPNRNRKIGYIVGGTGTSVSDNWQYDPQRDRWEKTNRFSSSMSNRVAGIGFVYNGYGYITVGGVSQDAGGDNTTWKFYPGIEAEDWNDY